MRSKSASCCLPFERLGRQGSLALHRPRNANCSQAPREPMSLNSLVQKILPVPRRRQAPPPQDLPETPHHRPRRTFDPQRLLRHRFRGELPYCRHQTCCRPTSPYRPPRARRARPERSTRARWESAHRMQGARSPRCRRHRRRTHRPEPERRARGWRQGPRRARRNSTSPNILCAKRAWRASRVWRPSD